MATTENICFDVLKHFTSWLFKQVAQPLSSKILAYLNISFLSPTE